MRKQLQRHHILHHDNHDKTLKVYLIIEPPLKGSSLEYVIILVNVTMGKSGVVLSIGDNRTLFIIHF